VCAVLWERFVSGLPTWRAVIKRVVSGSGLGWPAVDGESPVRENRMPALDCFPSSSGLVESAVNLPGPPGKPEYFPVTDSGRVP
jgi:hypothetical protein